MMKIETCKCGLLSYKKINEKDSENKFILQPLPYPENALSPYISEKTIRCHYGKHLYTYIYHTNQLKAGTPFDDMPLQEIVCKASGGLFNHAAQVFNHYFYFESLQASGKEMLPPQIERLIKHSFRSFLDFKEQFSQTALSLFGSGWVWLIKNKDQLEILPTINADTPIKHNKVPLLTIDVWEHAYYLDVQNARNKYIEDFWKIVNWNVVEQRIHNE